MADWWDRKARVNARKYIALHAWKTEDEFDKSGAMDAERVLSGVILPPDSKALEIGVGTGRIAKHSAEHFREISAVDVSSEMVRRAKERLAVIPNCKIFQTNGADLSIFPDETFDFVYSVYVFQHLPQRLFREYADEACRVLKTDGQFKFQIFENTRVFGTIPRFWLRNLRHFHIKFWRHPPDTDVWVARAYSRNEIREMLKGFPIVKMENPSKKEGDLWVLAKKQSDARSQHYFRKEA